MDEMHDHLQDIADIRNLMERQSKFLSLSGLSGISAGVVALAGAVAAWVYLGQSTDYITPMISGAWRETLVFLFIDGAAVLITALTLAAVFSARMAKRRNLPIWNASAKRMLVHLFIPLAAGGLFCLIQVAHHSAFWVPATTLMFYGMALLNAGKYTLPEIRFLGVSQILLGLGCAIWYHHALLFWALGFGVLHIAYGIVMFYKYER